MTALAAVDLGNLVERLLEPGLHELRIGADALEQRHDEPILLREQAREDVLGEDLLLIAASSDALRLLEGLLCLDRELVHLHGRQRNAATRRGKAHAKAWPA